MKVLKRPSGLKNLSKFHELGWDVRIGIIFRSRARVSGENIDENAADSFNF